MALRIGILKRNGIGSEITRATQCVLKATGISSQLRTPLWLMRLCRTLATLPRQTVQR
ncbi:hypothetical protein BJX63DRAFT_392317 [Aspergillus granulosus]|uniref:Uncharacterized protein n=1 Tax=Aspergillus granulosus TaxID=176169 RepID=A0ABR4HGD5_9EURO